MTQNGTDGVVKLLDLIGNMLIIVKMGALLELYLQ